MATIILPSRRTDPPVRTRVGRYVVSTIWAPSSAHTAWVRRWETLVISDDGIDCSPEDGEEWTTDPHETWALHERRVAEVAIAELRRLAEEVTAVAEAAGLGSIGITSTHVAAGQPDGRRVGAVLLHDAAGCAAVRATGHAEVGDWYGPDSRRQRNVRLADGHRTGQRVEVQAVEVAEDDLAPALAASVAATAGGAR